MMEESKIDVEETPVTVEEVKEEVVKIPCTTGKIVKMCPCKRHAWYESNYGTVRKPFKRSL